jgi:putative oxidoreductase
MPSSRPLTNAARTAARFEPIAYAALRIVAGIMFAMHGTQKLLGFPGGGAGPAVGSQLWIGGLIELVAGVLIAVGLFTRAAAFLASGTMAVAFFQFHFKMGDASILPIVNKGELAVLYCFVFLLFWARGSGQASVDGALRR